MAVNHLYQNPFLKLVRLGKHLAISHTGQRIVCLGNSPAWMVKAGEMVAQRRENKTEFLYIPFSGGFLTECQTKTIPYERRVFEEVDKDHDWTKEQGIAEYLKSQHLDPESIIASARRGKKTVFVDYIQSAKGIASFLSLLFSYTRDLSEAKELARALKVHLYGEYKHPKCIRLAIPNF